MIHEVDTNLLEYPLKGIIHQANCMCTMGSGIALSIKNKYPEAYEADLQTKRGDKSKLGMFSFAHIEKEDKYIFNLYSQYAFGTFSRHTSYDAMTDGFPRIIEFATQKGLTSLGLPKNIGCVRGGGNWNIVRSIIEESFKDCPIDLWICNYTP